MWFGLLLYLGGGLLAFVAIVGLLVFLFSLCGWVSLDGMMSLADGRAPLTCWHCGQQTRAGLRHCEHCGQELQ